MYNLIHSKFNVRVRFTLKRHPFISFRSGVRYDHLLANVLRISLWRISLIILMPPTQNASVAIGDPDRKPSFMEIIKKGFTDV